MMSVFRREGEINTKTLGTKAIEEKNGGRSWSYTSRSQRTPKTAHSYWKL